MRTRWPTLRPATGQKCVKTGPYTYTISWLVDNQVMGAAKVKKRRTEKRVDDVAAARFCKKWNIPFPEEKP